MPDILPTFHCFDDALDYLVQRVRAEPALADRETLHLVHALVLSDAGLPYAHAWCEEGDHCWDAGIVDGTRIWYAVRRDEYYAARRPVRVTRYSIGAAWSLNRRFGNYGPWEPAYIAACGRGDRRVTGRIQADASGAVVVQWGGDE